MEQKDIDELLNDSNQNILGEYDLTEMCIDLTHSELVNVIGWTLNELGYDKDLYTNQSLLINCIVHQINKANARKEGLSI
jgi:hypothetical protein|tara:strand:+ start:4093 stop:4332 length:240 start_codon:yes stop_codon:yes gene_type:complete